ncbi:MAG: hypothetical protein JO110_25620 [Acetobacteraceae bacterium]|nr:hypothetical protein [Acetobacteraceae bacterium]
MSLAARKSRNRRKHRSGHLVYPGRRGGVWEGMPEDTFSRGKRHVREGERRVAHLAGIIARLNQGRPPNHRVTAMVEKALVTVQHSLELARNQERQANTGKH